RCQSGRLDKSLSSSRSKIVPLTPVAELLFKDARVTRRKASIARVSVSLTSAALPWQTIIVAGVTGNGAAATRRALTGSGMSGTGVPWAGVSFAPATANGHAKDIAAKFRVQL